MPTESSPTLFHVTHWKAGSTWIDAILRPCAPDRVVLPREDLGQFLEDPIAEGHVYPRLYVTRQQFESVELPEKWRRFVVIRDLRDTLVSAYFSVKFSHEVSHIPDLAEDRQRLKKMSMKQGLHEMLGHWMVTKSAAIQRSWLESGDSLIRYEDLLDRDTEILERVLIEECELAVSAEALRNAAEAASFEALTGGRKRGNEDFSAHQRKGVAGDWRNYFREPLKDAFKQQWGELLVATGYADDLDW